MRRCINISNRSQNLEKSSISIEDSILKTDFDAFKDYKDKDPPQKIVKTASVATMTDLHDFDSLPIRQVSPGMTCKARSEMADYLARSENTMISLLDKFMKIQVHKEKYDCIKAEMFKERRIIENLIEIADAEYSSLFQL